MKDKISVIIPVYNEEGNIARIWSELSAVFAGLAYDAEFIFVDDGSRDASRERVQTLITHDKRVRYIGLSRNFGKEMALTAGLFEATGKAAIMIDADLQHPPRLILEMIARWEAGAEQVIGRRNGNGGAGLVKGLGSRLFRRIMKAIGEKHFLSDTTDFRLIDRAVIEEFKRFGEHRRLTRGLLDWLGFRQEFIVFRADARHSGQAAYSTRKLIHLALSAFISQSLFPLKFAGYLGIMIILFSGPLGLFIFIDKYILDDFSGLYFSGPAILAVINLFLIGIVLSCLGLIALYVGNIQTEATGRPLYVVRERTSFVAKRPKKQKI